MIETDFLWMAAVVVAPLVFALVVMLLPKNWPELGRWTTLIGQTLVLGILIGIQIQFRYDTIERWGVLADASSRDLGSIEARMERLDLLPDSAVRPGDDWVVRIPWIKNLGLSLLWTVDGGNLWIMMTLAILFIGSGMIAFARGGLNNPSLALILAMQSAAGFGLMAGDFITLLMAWGLWSLALALCALQVGLERPGPDKGILRRLGLSASALLGLIALVAGLSLKRDVRPVIGPDRIEESLTQGTPNDPAKWPETPMHTLDFTTLARLSRAQMAVHWGHQDIGDIQGILPATRIQSWIKEAQNPIGSVPRRPMTHSMDVKQLQGALKAEQAKAERSLAPVLGGWSGQTLPFWLLLAAAWIGFGLPPFRPAWRWLFEGTPPQIALPLAGATMALSWDLVARIALPMAPLGILTNLHSTLLYLGTIGPAALWVLARKQRSMRSAVTFVLPVSLFALLLQGALAGDNKANAVLWAAPGIDYLGGAMLFAVGLILLGLLFLRPSQTGFHGAFAYCPGAATSLAVGLLALAGLAGLAPFIGLFMTGLSLTQVNPLFMVGYFGGMALGLGIVITWTRQMLTPPPETVTAEPFPISATLASRGLILLLLVGGVAPTLVLNWLEPGATARVERLQKSSKSLSSPP